MSQYFSNKQVKANPKHKFGIVVAKFNHEYTQQLLIIAEKKLKESGVKNIETLWVPGSFELPFAAKKLIEKGCDAVLTLGVVIRGETSHYDYVCQASTIGTMKVQLDIGKPVIFGVLTCENKQQVEARLERAKELAISTIEMANLNQQ